MSDLCQSVKLCNRKDRYKSDFKYERNGGVTRFFIAQCTSTLRHRHELLIKLTSFGVYAITGVSGRGNKRLELGFIKDEQIET